MYCFKYCYLWFIWYLLVYLLDKRDNAVAKVEGTSGGVAFLLSIITCNIYSLYWGYKQGEKIDIAKSNRGLPSNNSGILYLILCICLPIVAWALMQNEINMLVRMDGTGNIVG